MGLDMYLYAKNYLSEYNPEEKRQSEAIQKLVGASKRVKSVVVEMAYWRKANAIHDWFVQNCQSGNDDCRETYVSKGQLNELHKLVCEVLATPVEELAAVGTMKLPTKPGFFFGSYGYDDGYLEDMKETRRQLDAIFASPEWAAEWDFYYRSSW